MKIVLTKLKLIYSRITGNIAFYPSIIAIFGVLFAFLMLYAEGKGISKYFIDNTPILVINDADTARVILSTFIGGIFSLMVFSFSMVMLLLNQASSNYSPRILPGLISNKRHQYVLGFFIAVIIYTIIILLSIEPTNDENQLPGFSVLVGIFLGIHVLAAFIYFIHSISQSIQVNNITNNIYTTAKSRMEYLIEKEVETAKTDRFEDTSSWKTYESKVSGHLTDIALDSLSEFCDTNDCLIDILVPKGTFVLKGVSIATVDTELSEEQEEQLRACFGYSQSEVVETNYVLGFKQLTEIALKAMSPGINDPGTAVTCIDLLTDLFSVRMLKSDTSYITNDDDEVYVRLKTIDFKELLYYIYASLRQYCKHDLIMMTRILQSLTFLRQSDCSIKDCETIFNEQIELVVTDAKDNIKNELDVQKLLSLLE